VNATPIIAGIYGRRTPADEARLEAALPPGAPIHVSGPLQLGWSGAIDSWDGTVACAVDGAVGIRGGAAAVAAEYERREAGLLEQARGRFTLAVWSRETGDGVLAVDQLGSSPLHIHEDGSRLYFASEIRDLLRLVPSTPGVEPRYLVPYLGGEPWPEELTAYAGIRRLAGAHVVELDGGRWRIRRYWAPRYTSRPAGDRVDVIRDLQAGIRNAVETRVAPAPGRSGILLSGGIDSTAVAATARGLLGEALHAYSAVFPDHVRSDESTVLAEITRELGLPWTRLVARRASLLGPSLEYLRTWRVPAVVPNLYFQSPLMGAATGDGVAVMLDGEGGDELFGCVGYAVADRLRRGDLGGAIRLLRRLPWDGHVQPWSATYHLFRELGVRGALPYRAHGARARRRSEPGGPPWLSSDSRALLSGQRDLWGWKRADGPLWWGYLSETLTRGRERYGVADTLRRLGSLAGVERRHPFLDDLDLIELVLAIPPELAFDPRHTRPLLREALAGLLPDVARLRTEKADFRSLIEDSLAGPERSVVASLVLAPDARIRPYISERVVADAVDKVGDPKFTPYQGGLLRMVTAECWLRTLEDGAFADRLLEQGLPSADVEIVPAASVR
jgi:asparagine synthase (glutamine-hydrolysing)